MRRRRPDSQEGRILSLLESAQGRKVPLPAILDLRPRISQYSRAIHTLRHKHGLHIENGTEPGRPDHTWFRLIERTHYPTLLDSADRQTVHEVKRAPSVSAPMLFSEAELQGTARWEDVG